jgi:hypothetical protein
MMNNANMALAVTIISFAQPRMAPMTANMTTKQMKIKFK